MPLKAIHNARFLFHFKKWRQKNTCITLVTLDTIQKKVEKKKEKLQGAKQKRVVRAITQGAFSFCIRGVATLSDVFYLWCEWLFWMNFMKSVSGVWGGVILDDDLTPEPFLL